MALLGAVLEKKRFFVGMKLAIDRHDAQLHVEHSFDEVSEPALGH
jgi:hypothetical protein